MSETPLPAEIESLRVRHSQLNVQKIQTETQLRSAEESLNKLKEQAQAEYGTSDIEALSRRLEQMETENLQKRQEYDQLLTSIEAKLAEIEQEYEASE